MLALLGIGAATGLAAACQGAAPQATQAPLATAVPQSTAAPQASSTPAPAAQPTDTPQPTAVPQAAGGVTEIQFFGFGDNPADFDVVLEAVNKKLASDGLGLKIKYQFTPFNDYGNMLVLKASAGEEFDGFLDAPWLKMTKMMADGAIIVQDDLVANAPNLLKEIPKSMWDANRFNGKIWGIPLGVAQGFYDGFVIRKDIREQLGLSEPKTLKDITDLLHTVVTKKPDMYALASDPNAAQFRMWGSQFKVQPQPVLWPDTEPFYSGGANFLVNNSGKALKAVAEWDYPDWQDTAKTFRDFYQSKIFRKDVMSITDFNVVQFTQGKYAVCTAEASGQTGKYIQALPTNVPTAKVEYIYPYEMSDPKPWSTFQQWNFMCISRTSKHPDKVIAIMDWLSIRENHDLMEYGIVGKHWKSVGDTEYELAAGNTYSFPGYELTWRPPLERTDVQMDPVEKQWYLRSTDPNNFTPSPLIGFTFDRSPVKTEVAAIEGLKNDYIKPLNFGVLDVEATFPKMVQAFKDAGLDKLLAEGQKQLDAFVAANKKG
jgi:putative aldouronate transport system substrate-binding protein